MSRTEPADQQGHRHPPGGVFDGVSSMTHALACLAGFHTWTALDPEVHGEGVGCVWCGEVHIVHDGPTSSEAWPVPPARKSA